MNYFIKFFTSFIIALLFITVCFAQNVTLNTQTEVDAFDPSTTTISGFLEIETTSSSYPITDLSNLSNLDSIGGNLIISHNDPLTNLDGFTNLNYVGKHLNLYSSVLTNLDALANLSFVG